MMRDLREKTKIVMLVVALAFVGLMVFEWGMDISGTSVASQTGELGRVNGEPVSYEAYNLAYQQLYDQARLQAGSAQLTRDQIREIEKQAFDEVVDEILLSQEIRRRGIRATDQEIVQAAQWMPHPELMQNELFLTDGQFDINKYQQFLTSPAANEDLLLQLENYYRATIPRSKLVRQVTAGMYLSDAELWQMWRDQNETTTVDYVGLDPAVLVPGDVEVTAAEIRTYYEEHDEEFERSESARVRVAYLQKQLVTADTAAAYQEALELRQEIADGADFAAVAARASDDPGTAQQGGALGTFGRGQMVEPFEEAAFSLPIGEVSQPVQTEFGFHLIQVQSREGDQATARHILVSYEPTDVELDRLFARADSLELIAERAGFDRAASAMGATVQEGVLISMDESFVPGVGSTVEAVEWARDEQLMEEPLRVSPVFETPLAFYIVEVDQYIEPGQIPLEEATPEIRRRLIVEKKNERAKQIGEEMVAEVRGGKTLEQAAQEHGLRVQSAGPFTRFGFNPVFGQANAVTGAAFGVAVGQVSDVVQSSAGIFIVRPKERTPADREMFESQKAQLRQFAMLDQQQTYLQSWLEELREEADILDRREEMRQAAATAPPLTQTF